MSPTPPTPRPPKRAAAKPGPWCGDWLSLLRECCIEDHRTIETELQPPMPKGSGTRIDSWGPFFYVDDEAEDVVQACEDRRLELGEDSADNIVRFRVSNEIVQNQRRSGVAYRFTKSETDKVRRENPVPWGSIVKGFDEGDGWLRVGRYFLPMTYQGMPLLVPVGEAPSAVASSSPSNILHAARAPRAKPTSLRTRANSRGSQSGSLPVDRRPPTAATARARGTSAEPAEQARSPSAPSAMAPVPGWRLLPSVGTWLRLAPQWRCEQLSAVADGAAAEEAAAVAPPQAAEDEGAHEEAPPQLQRTTG